MRRLWFLMAAAAGAGLLALAMLLINIGFELAGSVPDLSGGGFLAGDLVAMGILFGACAACLGYKAAALLRRRFADCERAALRCGTRIGLGGSALYLGLGLAAVIAAPHGQRLAEAVWYVVALYVALAAVAGRAGAWLGMQRALVSAASESGS